MKWKMLLVSVLGVGLLSSMGEAQHRTPPPNYLTLTCTEAAQLALKRNESSILDAQVTSALYAYAPSHPHTNPTLLRELTPYIEYYCAQTPSLPLYAVLTQVVVDLTYITLKGQ